MRTARLFFSIATLALAGPVLVLAQASPNACKGLSGNAKAGCLLDQVEERMASGDYRDATPYAFEALEIAREREDPGLQVRANLATAALSKAKGDHTNAMRQYVAALRLASHDENSRQIVEAKIGVADVFIARENYKQAETNLNEALELALAEDLYASAARAHALLGSAYLAQEIIGKSQQNLQAALELYLRQEDYVAAAEVSADLADQYLATGDYDNAEVFAEQTLQLHTSTQDLRGVARDNIRLAEIYAGFDDYASAIDLTEVARGLYKRLDEPASIAGTYRDLALYQLAAGDQGAARAAAAEAVAVLGELDRTEGADVARDVAMVYDRLGDTGAALGAQKDYIARREAFFDAEKSRALVELTTRFESEFETEQQNRRIAEYERAEANTRVRFLLLLGLAGLLLAFAVQSFLSARRKQRDNALLMVKNEEIQRQKTEIDLKNLELAEANDGLAGLNGKLVDEMAERESIQKTSFARDRFLATMSHEMRTPINIISGLCHLLLEENPRADQTEHLRTLQFSANNLVVFINDILDFSKIEAGKLNLEKREFSPKRLFDEIAARFAQSAKQTSVEVSYDYDDKIPACLMGDPARFNQIMTNLVQTSFQHSVNAKVHVAARVEELRDGEAMIRFQIDDEGQVMDQKMLESMFRSFAFNPDDAFEGYNSSDLVLAITRRLVDLQNGHIEVKPRPEGGNRFMVLLTFKVVSKSDQVKRKGLARSFEHLEGNKVLLVEDNKINQLVVLKMLTRLGIEVVTADNGVEALEVVNHHAFDLCLMDIQMPQMDGYRATAEIRKHANPAVRDIPVIALTASAFLSEREKAKLFGMNDHVGKPFAPEELLDKMSACLDAYREERDGEAVEAGKPSKAPVRESN